MRNEITIGFIKDYCESINYICISTEYTGGKYKLSLICDNGHNCAISFNNLFYYKRRCVYCSNRKPKTMEYILDFCNKSGWKCLETTYINCYSKMTFICPKGHQILKNFRDLEMGKGCRVCLRLQKPGIKEVIDYCTSIGFTCLSKNYTNARTKLNIRCYQNHIFQCCLDKLKQHRGCPYCSSSRREKIVRYIVEELTGEKFIKIRPDFLKFPKTMRNLEIDMFNKSLNVGIEYQGEQHSKIVGSFKMSKKSLADYIERDIFKKQMCEKEGIKLVCIPAIPYHAGKYGPQQIKKIIMKALIDNNIKYLNKNIDSNNIIKAGNI